MANQTNGNQFRDDEIVDPRRNYRDGKMVKNIHPKIGGRLRLAHEQNQQISITTEIIKYDENLAVWLSFRLLSTDSALRWRDGSS